MLKISTKQALLRHSNWLCRSNQSWSKICAVTNGPSFENAYGIVVPRTFINGIQKFSRYAVVAKERITDKISTQAKKLQMESAAFVLHSFKQDDHLAL